MRNAIVICLTVLVLGSLAWGQPIQSNIIQLKGEPSGTAPQLFAAGQDQNISINAVPKGTGCFQINGVCIGSGGGGAAPASATYLTWTNQVATLPNSRNVLAGTNVTFDDTVANQRTINVPVTPGGVGVSGVCAVNEITVWLNATTVTCFPDFLWNDTLTSFYAGSIQAAPTFDQFLIGPAVVADGSFVYAHGSTIDLTGALDSGAWGENHTISASDSFAFGSNCTISGLDSWCGNAGGLSTVSANDAYSLGPLNTVAASSSMALGEAITINGLNSLGAGPGPITIGIQGGVAIGIDLTATDASFDTFQFGESMTATHTGAMLLGYNLTSQANTSVSIGVSPTPEMTITAGQIAMPGAIASGSATGRRVLCIDNVTKVLYISSTGTDCSN